MFAWALGESTVWPIIPDFLLLPMVAARPRRALVPLAVSLLGSAVGASLWYVWASQSPAAALHRLRTIPLVHPGQIEDVRTRIEQKGERALFAQPWSGVGLKVWAPVAAAAGIPARRALPAFIAARAVRMGVVSAGTAILARVLARWIEALALPLTVVYLAGFFPLWWRVATRDYGDADR